MNDPTRSQVQSRDPRDLREAGDGGDGSGIESKVKRHASAISRGGQRIDRPTPAEFQICDRCERSPGDASALTPTPVGTQEQCVAWNDYLAKWSLNYPVHARFRAVLINHFTVVGWEPALHIQFEFDTPDVRDPTRKLQQAPDRNPPHNSLLAPSAMPDENTPRWLRANMLYHLNHELDEFLTFDGQRPFDPHHESHHTCDRCLTSEIK